MCRVSSDATTSTARSTLICDTGALMTQVNALCSPKCGHGSQRLDLRHPDEGALMQVNALRNPSSTLICLGGWTGRGTAGGLGKGCRGVPGARGRAAGSAGAWMRARARAGGRGRRSAPRAASCRQGSRWAWRPCTMSRHGLRRRPPQPSRQKRQEQGPSRLQSAILHRWDRSRFLHCNHRSDLYRSSAPWFHLVYQKKWKKIPYRRSGC